MGVIYLQDSSDTSLTTCLHVAGKFLSVTACNGELEGRVDNSYFFLSCSPLMVIFESVTFLYFCFVNREVALILDIRVLHFFT